MNRLTVGILLSFVVILSAMKFVIHALIYL